MWRQTRCVRCERVSTGVASDAHKATGVHSCTGEVFHPTLVKGVLHVMPRRAFTCSWAAWMRPPAALL